MQIHCKQSGATATLQEFSSCSGDWTEQRTPCFMDTQLCDTNRREGSVHSHLLCRLFPKMSSLMTAMGRSRILVMAEWSHPFWQCDTWVVKTAHCVCCWRGCGLCGPESQWPLPALSCFHSVLELEPKGCMLPPLILSFPPFPCCCISGLETEGGGGQGTAAGSRATYNMDFGQSCTNQQVNSSNSQHKWSSQEELHLHAGLLWEFTECSPLLNLPWLQRLHFLSQRPWILSVSSAKCEKQEWVGKGRVQCSLLWPSII